MKSTWITFIVSLVIIGAGIAVAVTTSSKPSIYTEFAQFLAEEEATFYGAFWCPHCLDQKRMFGNAEKYLDYVECSTPDRSGQTPVCTEAGITSYPTWEFAGGQRTTGALDVEVLAAITGCELPEEHETAPQYENVDLEALVAEAISEAESSASNQ
jgi:thiol-disulfide isomerase/thioredoxin